MIFLEVPFREKDQAKSLGARWDAVSKRWYIPSDYDGDISLFDRWKSPNDETSSLNHKSVNLSIDSRSESLDFSGQAVETEQKGIRLSEVLFKVQNILRNGMPGATWVVAEIANINSRRGHIYLELTETNEQGQTIATCRAMIWQSQAKRLLQRFESETGSQLLSGQKVLILAEVSFHSQYGFSLVIQDLDPSYTLGELEQKLNQIRQNLIKKGIYQQNKQLTLATDFFRIAVIAPPQAAGLGDFRADADILQKHDLCEFKYFYSSFQGEAVESEMQAAFDAIDSLNQSKSYDALVIIRGGGAKLDLNMLNIESIAEKICLLSLPVLSGIGHERDNTIIDEVAHSRFDTPSKVIGYIRNQITQQAKQAQSNWQGIEKSSRIKVQLLHNAINKLHHQITQNSQTCTYNWEKRIAPLNHEIQRMSLNIINRANQTIESSKHAINATVQQRLQRVSLETDQLKSNIYENSRRAIETQKQQLIQSISFILSSGPKVQLNRGFCIAKDTEGNPLTTAKQTLQHKRINLEFSDGVVAAQIEQNQKDTSK